MYSQKVNVYSKRVFSSSLDQLKGIRFYCSGSVLRRSIAKKTFASVGSVDVKNTLTHMHIKTMLMVHM